MNFTRISRAALFAVAAVPFITFAQTTVTDLPSLFLVVLDWINSIVVPLVFAIAFVAFLIGIYYYFIQSRGNPEKTGEGRTFLLWGLIGFFIMFSVWGLINLFLGTLGFDNASQPGIPTFSNTTSAGSNLLNNFLGSTATNGSSSYLPAGSVVPPTSTGACPAGTTPYNGACEVMSANTVSTAGGVGSVPVNTADGTVPPGGSCTTDSNCEDVAGQSYGCYPEGNGTCTPDGDAVTANTADGTVGPGGSCTTDSNCEDVAGQSYGCYPEGNGTCTPDGDAVTANTADGTVGPGGSCTTDSNCEDVAGQSYGCYPEGGGVCTADGDATAPSSSSGTNYCCDDGSTDQLPNGCDDGDSPYSC